MVASHFSSVTYLYMLGAVGFFSASTYKSLFNFSGDTGPNLKDAVRFYAHVQNGVDFTASNLRYVFPTAPSRLNIIGLFIPYWH